MLSPMCTGHRWIAHELDPTRTGWPYDGAERRCVECGHIEVCHTQRGGRLWTDKGFRPFVVLEPVL